MIKEFVFCVGLPGCGKSTHLSENYPEAVVVSADEIKKTLPGYNAEHPEYVHEESVQAARNMIYNLINTDTDTVVLDGGGINNHYNLSIIEKFRNDSPDTKITCLFFDTPIDVCIERVSKRERKVPVSEIYKKNLKLVSCIEKYKPLVDEFIRVSYYTNKHILLDMDGTIAGYGKSKYDMDGDKDFCCSELFLHLRPVQHVIDFIKENCDLNEVYICSAVANSIVWEQKNIWLDKHFPEIPKENRLFVGNKDYKHVFVKNYSAMRGWDIKDVTLIDDLHSTINKCEKLGINAIHPSNIEVITDKYSYQA